MTVISALTLLIGLMILAIFGLFRRPDVGLGIIGLVIVPATAWFWLDFAILRRRTLLYVKERDAR